MVSERLSELQTLKDSTLSCWEVYTDIGGSTAHNNTVLYVIYIKYYMPDEAQNS